MILEISYNFETSEISFVVSNVRELLDPESKFLKDLTTSTNAAATLLEDKYKWDGATDKTTELDEILNSTWDAATRAINSGVNNSVVIDNRGIRITDPNDPMHIIAIVAGWLGISSDGGNNYNTVLNADGIAAKYLIGQIVLAAELHIINQGGNIEIGENGILVYDQDGVKRIHIGDFGDFTDPSYIAGTNYGFYFKGRTDPITGQEHYLEWDGTKLKIGGDLDAVTGTFNHLKAGSDENYMELFEEGFAPYINFYQNTIHRMQLKEDAISFRDETGKLLGFIKGTVSGIDNVPSLFSISYDTNQLVAIPEGATIPYSKYALLQNRINENIPETYIQVEDNGINSFIKLTTEQIDVQADSGDILIQSTNAEKQLILRSGSLINNNRQIVLTEDNITISTITNNANIKLYTWNENSDIEIKTSHSSSNIELLSNNIITAQSKSESNVISNPNSIVLNGILGITHIDDSDRQKAYRIHKNGQDAVGVINFKCEE